MHDAHHLWSALKNPAHQTFLPIARFSVKYGIIIAMMTSTKIFRHFLCQPKLFDDTWQTWNRLQHSPEQICRTARPPVSVNRYRTVFNNYHSFIYFPTDAQQTSIVPHQQDRFLTSHSLIKKYTICTEFKFRPGEILTSLRADTCSRAICAHTICLAIPYTACPYTWYLKCFLDIYHQTIPYKACR